MKDLLFGSYLEPLAYKTTSVFEMVLPSISPALPPWPANH